MNPVQLHLALNHVPIMIIPVGLALVAWGLLRRSDELKRAGLVVIVAACLVSIPVFYSGDGAEEIVKRQTEVDHRLINEHEDSAEWAFMALLITGGLAGLVLVLSLVVKRFAWAPVIVVISGLVTSSIVFRTAHLGGLIRHPELDAGAPRPSE